MKSYFLEGLTDAKQAQSALSQRLPRQCNPWILTGQDGDAIAYFVLNQSSDGKAMIQADLSGRHSADANVIGLLRELQSALGGQLTDDDDNAVLYLQGWSFSVKETSSGCYRAIGIGPHRMKVEHNSTDHEEALNRAKEYADEMSRRTGR